MQTPPDLRTTSQKLKNAFKIMYRSIDEEAFTITAEYANDISGYMNMLESDMGRFIYHNEYVLNGILDS